jgi:hypothetical protein
MVHPWQLNPFAIVPAEPAAVLMSTDSEESKPADDPNDRDFAPSPLLRRPRARSSGGLIVQDSIPAAVNALASPSPPVALFASQATFGVFDKASAKKELLSKMSAHGHQAFIRCDLW